MGGRRRSASSYAGSQKHPGWPRSPEEAGDYSTALQGLLGVEVARLPLFEGIELCCVQPLRAHQHWHIDIAYLNLAGTFYYLCSILDGASRSIVHWEIREAMKEADVECILLRAREMHPNESPRVISDNGPQFIAKDFKEFIRLTGMTHVRTAPYYPQSNGKLERYHKTIKTDAIRPGQPSSVDEARAVVTRFVEHYNTVRLHSAIGYITPADFLAARGPAHHAWSITTNLPFKDWGQLFPSAAAASAIADRLVHRGILVRITGKSKRSDQEVE